MSIQGPAINSSDELLDLFKSEHLSSDFLKEVVRIARNYVQEADADDVSQDNSVYMIEFVRKHKHIPEIGVALSKAKFQAIDILRKNKRSGQILFNYGISGSPSPHEEFEELCERLGVRKFDFNELVNFPGLLNEKQRKILQLLIKEKKTQNEIAKQLQCSQPNICYRIERIFKKIKKHLAFGNEKKHE